MTGTGNMIRERVVRFGPDKRLAGILTLSREARGDLPHIVIVNAGIIHRVGPNRLYVDLARTAAALGYPVLRFDLAGLGDSDALTGVASLNDAAMTDVQSAYDFLTQTRQASSFIIFGLCSGANFAVMSTFIETRVIGALLIDPTVERTTRSTLIHVARRLRHFATLQALLTLRHPIFQRSISLGRVRSVAVARAAEGQSGQRYEPELQETSSRGAVRASLEEIVNRGVHLMLVFTGGVNHVYNYRNQLFDLLPGLDFRGQLRLEYMPNTDHTVSDGPGRAQLLVYVREWLTAAFPAAAVTESLPVSSADERTEAVI